MSDPVCLGQFLKYVYRTLQEDVNLDRYLIQATDNKFDTRYLNYSAFIYSVYYCGGCLSACYCYASDADDINLFRQIRVEVIFENYWHS